MLGENVRKYRKAKDMLQCDLAAKSGLSPGYISLIESGGRPTVSMGTLEALAGPLGVTPGDLLAKSQEEQAGHDPNFKAAASL